MARAAALAVGLLLAAQASAIGTGADWSHYGGDAGGSRYSTLAEIHTGNVAQLKVAWSWATGEAPLAEFGTSPGLFEATPLVIDGVMYLSTPYNRVVALDAASGRELWAFDPGAYRAGQVPNGMGFVHRGVAAWRDSRSGQLRILINTRTRLIQLDAATGKPVETFGAGGTVDLLAGLRWPVKPEHYTNTSPPVVHGDLVIVGNGVADRLIYRRDPPGDLRAWDLRTGRLVWTFHTVPLPGQPGSETWENEAIGYTGHTNVWGPMALDAERGLLYASVGTPSNDFFGGNRPGDGLYGDSIVCLEAATGKLRWHFQFVRHGLWDYDPPGSPVLVRVRREGRTIDAVVQLTKQGFAFAFERETGKPLWPIEDRAVPPSDVPGERASPTQPFPTGLPALVPQGISLADANDLTPELHAEALAVLKQVRLGPLYTPPSLQGTVMLPGIGGGANWGGGAFDPDTGVLYAKVNNMPEIVYPDLTDAEGNVPEVGPNDAPAVSLLLRRRIPVTKPPWAFLDAIDLDGARMLWQQPFGDNAAVRAHPALAGVKLPPKLGATGAAGVIVTRGGLLFAGGGDTAFHAIDAKSGADLWRHATDGQKVSSTPMSYRAGGRQFVAVAVGGPGPGARLLAFSL